MYTVERAIREYNGEKKVIKFLTGVGNLTQDIKSRKITTKNGETFVAGGYDKELGRPPAIALDYLENGEKKAAFFPIEAWGRTAELLGEFGKKGVELFAYGRIEGRKNINPNTGKEYVNEVFVIECFRVTSRSNRTAEGAVEISGFSPVDDEEVSF